DTVAKLLPKSEYEADMEKAAPVMVHARLMTSFCRRLKPRIAKSRTVIWAINQIRVKMTMYGASSTSTGGNAFEHELGLRIKTDSLGVAWDKKDTKEKLTGMAINFRLKKNKIGDFHAGENSIP